MIESVLGELSLFLVAVAALCLLLVGSIKGIAGFGTGLFAVPLISKLFSPTIALGLLTITLWLGNIHLIAEAGLPRRVLAQYRGHFLAAIIGALLGYALFTLLPESGFYLVLGLYICGYLVTRNVESSLLPSPMDWPNSDLLSGGSGGAVMGAFLSGGPVFVSYYQSLEIDQNEFAACLGTVTALTMGVRLLPMYATGEFGIAQTAVGVLLFLPLAAGVSLGSRVRESIPSDPFNRVVEVLLLIVALNLFYDGLIAVL